MKMDWLTPSPVLYSRKLLVTTMRWGVFHHSAAISHAPVHNKHYKTCNNVHNANCICIYNSNTEELKKKIGSL